ncbi:MAG: hypothetical protein Q8N62_01155 [Candidatus Omnitrophota bacterium]|nr:hypothetical protein [Candidatus Omnitrophota bacterium]
MHKEKIALLKMFLWQKIILIIFGIFLSIIFLEIGLRIAGWTFLSLREYQNKLSIKQKGAYRIMCIGESTTFCGGDYSYPSQLEKILNGVKIGVNFSVINKGIPAGNSSLILSSLIGNINKYKPSMVVVMMGVNDKVIYLPYPFVSPGRTFLDNFKVYKLVKLLRLHILANIREIKTTHREKNDENEGVFLNKDSGFDYKDADLYRQLGDSYKAKEDYMRTENMYKKAIGIASPKDQNAYFLYCTLAWFYNDIGNYAKAEETFKKCIELYPDKDFPQIEFAEFYRVRSKYSQCEELIKKVIALSPVNEDIYIKLGLLYADFGKFSLAEEAFKKAINVIEKNKKESEDSLLFFDKYRIYAKLAALYTEIGRHKDADRFYEEANELIGRYYNPTTRSNYLKIREILNERGIKLVCVQYPVRSIWSLKKIFEGQDEVIFVDNEMIFKDVLKKGYYREYFTDMFGGDFGHCTLKGNRLLAENIARSILKESFNR